MLRDNDPISLLFIMAIAQKLYRKAFHLSFDLHRALNLFLLNQRPLPRVIQWVIQWFIHPSLQPTQAKLAPLALSDRAIVNALQTDGAYVTSLATLNLPDTDCFWSSAQAIAHALSDSQANSNSLRGGFRVEASANQLLNHPALIRWGVGDRLLSVVEDYLQEPAALCSVIVRRDMANGLMRGTRLWHRDIEDRRMCKVIVYLNAVSEKNGPFAYLSRQTTDRCRMLKARYGYLRDRIMQSYLASFEDHLCVGAEGTVIFCDTAATFHRGVVPVEGDRLAVFFTYVTHHPRSPWKCKLPFQLQSLVDRVGPLTTRQQNALFGIGKSSW
ncbi:MAG: hypothetical protein VKL39_03265 [Leptolyngbyaceae bacterium]|nr:hypothetical protein [Leptolyngbyaceae bacterium]